MDEKQRTAYAKASRELREILARADKEDLAKQIQEIEDLRDSEGRIE